MGLPACRISQQSIKTKWSMQGCCSATELHICASQDSISNLSHQQLDVYDFETFYRDLNWFEPLDAAQVAGLGCISRLIV
jgi:methionine synthase II (cobalamin-independent)